MASRQKSVENTTCMIKVMQKFSTTSSPTILQQLDAGSDLKSYSTMAPNEIIWVHVNSGRMRSFYEALAQISDVNHADDDILSTIDILRREEMLEDQPSKAPREVNPLVEPAHRVIGGNTKGWFLLVLPLIQRERDPKEPLGTDEIYEKEGNLGLRPSTFKVTRSATGVPSNHVQQQNPSISNPWVSIVDQLWLAIPRDNMIVTCCPSRSMEEREHFFARVCKRVEDETFDDVLPDLLSEIVKECSSLPPDFLRCTHALIEKAHSDRAQSYRLINELYGRLPEPEAKSYDKILRHISDELIRIHQELAWVYILMALVEDIDIVRRTVDIPVRYFLGLKMDIEAMATDELKPTLLSAWSRLDATGRRVEDERAYALTMLGDEAVVAQNLIKELSLMKQTLSGVLGSQFQLRQVDASTRSSNIIMYFTMMTILFSSLSFMAAFFALNIRSFPRNNAGNVELSMSYVTSRIVAWSIAMAAPFWILAVFLNPVADLFKILKAFFSFSSGLSAKKKAAAASP